MSNKIPLITLCGFPTDYFAQQPLYDWIANDYLKDGMKIIEIGVFAGRSAVYMAEKIKELGLKVQFDAVDHFNGSGEHQSELSKYPPDELYNTCLQNVKNRGVENYINVIRKESIEFSKTCEDGTYDFIFVDAAHDYNGVKLDLAAWTPKLKTGGIIAGDDYHSAWSGVIKAVDEKFGGRVKLYTEPNIHPRWLPPTVWYIGKHE